MWWRGTDSNHRRQCQQIYSLIPLATREPLQGCVPALRRTGLTDDFPTQQLRGLSMREKWWRGTDSNHRRQCQQIYSLIPLATREPLQGCVPALRRTGLTDDFPTQQSRGLSMREKWWRGTDSNHRRQCQQIYSLIPLATREPLQGCVPALHRTGLTDDFPTQQSRGLSMREIWWRGTDSNHRRQCQQIYSLIPLATREPLQVFLYLANDFPTQ